MNLFTFCHFSLILSGGKSSWGKMRKENLCDERACVSAFEIENLWFERGYFTNYVSFSSSKSLDQDFRAWRHSSSPPSKSSIVINALLPLFFVVEICAFSVVRLHLTQIRYRWYVWALCGDLWTENLQHQTLCWSENIAVSESCARAPS